MRLNLQVLTIGVLTGTTLAIPVVANAAVEARTLDRDTLTTRSYFLRSAWGANKVSTDKDDAGPEKRDVEPECCYFLRSAWAAVTGSGSTDAEA